MHKNEFIKQVAKETALSRREVSQVLQCSIELIAQSLQNGDKVVLTGFGTFEMRTRRERRGVNPKTKEHITIPFTRTPGFTASTGLKLAVLGRLETEKIGENFDSDLAKGETSLPKIARRGRKPKAQTAT